jgi:AraC family transcriptional regulator
MDLTLVSHPARRLVEPAPARGIAAAFPSHPADVNVVIAQTASNRVDAVSVLNFSSPARGNFVIARMLRSRPGHGMTEPHWRADAYVACVHLDKFDDYDVWCDNEHISSRRLDSGTIHIDDMRQEWRADIRSPFHVMNFCVPQAALDELSDQQGVPKIEELKCPINHGHIDTVFKNLALALLPALDKPDQLNRLFAEHASRTITAYLAKTYGSTQLRFQRSRGGLAPWQERRAKEMLTANLSGDLSLSELAGACRLSLSHFSQSFRRTVGYPPHKWLLTQRVERAKQLLLNTDRPLCEIALDTGFADQSHFTRVFSERVSSSPAAWRRAQKR